MLDHAWCRLLAQRIREHEAIAALVPTAHVTVQCTYFEKSAEQNWLVAVHQDLSIPVAEKSADPSLRGWSEKEGALYVQAPVETLEDMVAVRLHLDPCKQTDGALRVVPGSHRLGVLSPADARQVRDRRTEVTCELDRGGALAMRPLLLHASSKASGDSRRRVLHFVFGPRLLAHGLRWQCAV